MKSASAFLRRSRAPVAGAAALILGGPGLAGCYINDEGLPPPTRSFYYPTGLVISPGGKVLYVANSDFDLQYNGGTVQALDLDGLRDKARTVQKALLADDPGPCAANPDPVLYPGPCAPTDAEPFVRSTAIIGAFASGMILTHRPVLDPTTKTTNARLFVTVRGDPSVTYFDVGDDRSDIPDAQPCEGAGCFDLDCGDSRSGGSCVSEHRIGKDATENVRHLLLPIEPVGIDANPSGERIVVAHQTKNAASLLSNVWSSNEKPSLDYTRTGLSDGPTEVAAVPPPRLIERISAATTGGSRLRGVDYQPGFLLTFRAAPELDLLRFGPAGSDSRPFLTVATAIGITTLANDIDSRGIAVDAGERQACERRCSDGLDQGALDCLAGCVAIPLRMYLVHRSPSSLLIGEVATTLVKRDPGTFTDPMEGWASGSETLTIRDTVPLAAGASRVALGHVVGRDGALELRVFAVSFDSGLAFSYDPAARRIESVIRTGRGPHALTFDTAGGADPYSFMYVGHFTDSYLGVVDLDTRNPKTFGQMIMTLGKPVPPRGSQ